jgi:Flp pilus assembly CpaE family ATPase
MVIKVLNGAQKRPKSVTIAFSGTHDPRNPTDTFRVGKNVSVKHFRWFFGLENSQDSEGSRVLLLRDEGMNRIPLRENPSSRERTSGWLESHAGGNPLDSGISSSSIEANSADFDRAKLLSIALICPNERRRWDVSSILAECRAVTVREFSSYPTALDDVPKLLERYFDVILVDLDTDQEFALKLVGCICAENTSVVMVYTEKADKELMSRCMRAGAREYLLLPFDQSTLGKALDRARIGMHSKTRPSRETQGDLLVFLGAKGGAGVTTIACNLAIALAQEPSHSTLLIDLAVPLGDAALNLGIAAEYSTDHALRNAERLDARLLHTFLARHRSGVFVLAAPSKVPEIEAPKAAIDKLVHVARQQFDHVIVDAGSRIDLMSTDLFKKAVTIYLVTQAGISELRNSNRLISQFFNEGAPNLEIVLNRFAPHLQAGVNEEVITKALGRPVRWKIPDDLDATRQMRSADTASSLADSPVSRLILEMAGSVTGRPALHGRDFPDESSGSGQPGTVIKDDLPPSAQAASLVISAPAAATPAITWPAPDPITYGSVLSAIQLNATASVPGTLVYTPGPGYLLPAGTHTLWVTFNPAHSAGGSPLQAAASITVSKAEPAVTWPAPAAIAAGSALDASHLNATASVAGEFVYRPDAGEVLDVGTHLLSLTFTPADSANYTPVEASVSVTVGKQTPIIQWPEPEPITYGVGLGPGQLNATASVPGECIYHPAAGDVLGAGTHKLTVTFTPADDALYCTEQASVTITVAKATAVITWPQPAPITYGERLGNGQLGATASVPGSFAFNPCEGALLAVGEHTPSLVFTPDDAANYEPAQAFVRLTVAKATPTVSWPPPEPISCGEALSAAQLNATASVPGSFAYEPAAGEILAPGTNSLALTFTPADSLNYSIVDASVSLTVMETSPTEIAWPAPSCITYGTPLGDEQLNATASAPGTFVYTPAAGHVLAPGKYALSAAFAPTDPMSYAPAQAIVELIVEDPANTAATEETVSIAAVEEPAQIADIEEPVCDAAAEEPTGTSLEQSEPEQPLFALGAVAWRDIFPDVQREGATITLPPQNQNRETRMYKGAIYEKGEDGQWHLQQK